MTAGQVPFKIVPLLLLLFGMNYPPITCQNCGLPATIRVSEQLAESLDTGQPILPHINARNTVKISEVIQNPGDFANITLIPETKSSSALLSVQVATPLWKPSAISYIDESRLEEIEIIVKLECGDGQYKYVHIFVPIMDENTAMPRFDQPNYELTAEPCVLERCSLIFEKDIMAVDEDRDEINAEVYLWTDMPDMISFHGAPILETWYGSSEYGVQEPRGYQIRTKLGYIPDKNQTTLTKSISFTIYANNTLSPVAGFVPPNVASSTITVNFQENPDKMLAPVFTSPAYFAFLEYDSMKLSIEPRNIYASVPGLYHNESDIQYVLEGEPENLFHVDSSGNLSCIGDIYDIGKNRVDYILKAERRKPGGKEAVVSSSTVPLIIYLEYSTCPTPTPDPCLPTDEPTTSTEPSYTSTEAPSTTSLTDLPTITTPETTSDPTTTETSDTTTTTQTPPTGPPEPCRCNCDEFSCRDPIGKASLNSTFHIYYPDPYQCTKYHRCPNPENGPVDDDDRETFYCPPETVFCPIISACTTVEMCLSKTSRNNISPAITGYGSGGGGSGDEEDECEECQCQVWIPPGHPENICTRENYEMLIPDPLFCDVFHKCQPTGNPDSFYDYPMRCPAGTVFCVEHQVCRHYNEPGCSSCGTDKMLQQCDVCIMGLWEGFDIFNKRFI